MSDWFQTATGKQCWVTNPDRSEVCIEDIAAALSRQCRYAGHLQGRVSHFSVAEHSVLVSQVCLSEHALIGLLHDATEAYIQDIIRPLKQVLAPIYKPLEDAWAARIGREFGLGDALVFLPADVRHADKRVLMTEKRDLRVKADNHPADIGIEPLGILIEPLPPLAAREQFLMRFHHLCDEAGR